MLPWWLSSKESTGQRQEAQVLSLGREDPLVTEMVTHSSVLDWRIPWIEEAGGLQSMGSQRVGYKGIDLAHTGPTQCLALHRVRPLSLPSIIKASRGEKRWDGTGEFIFRASSQCEIHRPEGGGQWGGI